MRVLIVSHLALPHVGGVETLVNYEIRALVAAGHEVTLVTSDGAGQAQSPLYPPSARIERVPAWHVLERQFRLPYPIFSPRLLPLLWRQIGSADVIHLHGFLFLSSLAAAILARIRGKPIILTDHGGIQHFDSGLKSALVRIGAATVGRMVACCATELVAYNTRIARLLERLAGNMRKCQFLPNPVDRRLFRPAAPDERRELRSELGWDDRPRVLFIGRLTAEKGVPMLAQCNSPDYELVFCGSGDPSILGPLPRPGVSYLPPRPQSDLVRLYQAADLLVVPSKVREGFPLVVQEAWSCGLAVVLGYDEGFEPYRVLPGLSFCEATVPSVRNAIQAALASPGAPPASEALAEFCPSFDTWIRRLYGRWIPASEHRS